MRKNRSRTLLAALVIALGLPGLGAGRSAAPEPEVDERGAGVEAPADTIEDRIVVTAGRTEQRLREVPVKVTVLDREEISALPAQAPDDLLRIVPSLNLRSGDSSRVTSVSGSTPIYRGLAGTTSSRTLVLVDGVPLNEPFAGWIAWNRVPTAALERIEVVPTGAAGAWGNQALGGVIHLITRRPAPSSLDTDLGFGSRDTSEATVLASDVRGRAAISAFASLFTTDGYSDVPKAFQGPADTTNASEAVVVDGRIELAAASNRLWTLQIGHFDQHQDRGDRISTEELAITSWRGALDRMGADGAQWQANLFALRRESSNTRGSFNDERTEVEPRRIQPDNPSLSVGAGLSWQRGAGESGQRLVVGLDGLWTDSELNERSDWDGERFVEGIRTGGRQLLAGAFAQTRWEVGADLLLSAGLRLDHWRTAAGFFELADLPSGERLIDDRHPDNSEWIANPNLGVVWSATERVALRAALFQSFRAPTPNEMYKSSPTSRDFVAGNPDLEPERIRVGVELGADVIAGPRLGLRTALFWNDVSDPIIQATVAVAGDEPVDLPPCGVVRPRGTCQQRRNLGRLRSRGVELEAELRPADAWRLRLSYALTDSRIVDSPDQHSLEGRRMPNVPRHKAVLQAIWRAPLGLETSAQVRYIGERFDDDLNVDRMAEAVVTDLRVGRRFGEALELSLEVQNAFDEPVEVGANADFADLGQPRALRLGLRYRFRGAGSAP